MAPIAVDNHTVAKIAELDGLEAAGVAHELAEQNSLAPLDASLTTVEYTTRPRHVPLPDSPETQGAKVCTDHMITAEWDAGTGWATPQVKPYGPLSLEPTASVLHYATECFEGMKLYRGDDGKLRLFRPERNAQRLNMSAARIALPAPDPDQMVALVGRLAAIDAPRWLIRRGEFLYVRPTLIGTDAALGVQRPRRALLYILLCIWPAEDCNPKGMRLLASAEDTVRAWPGGFGYAKVGASYGPSLTTQGEAWRRGFAQVLWLLKHNERVLVTEAGAANFFVVLRRPDSQGGGLELVTPGLESKVILEGVTRDSILCVARKRLTKGGPNRTEGLEPLEVSERDLDMAELLAAAAEGRLVEAFAAGTAFFIAAVSAISYNGSEISIPMAAGSAGAYTAQLKQWISDIMYGREAPHPWGYVIEEEKR